jgi:hypothetical protein
MHYVKYINTIEEFVNKYIVPSINITFITYFKNELGNAPIVTIG